MKNLKQYNGTGTPMEGTVDVPATKPTTISAETRHIQSVESLVKQLQDNIGIQQQELMRLNREINRLKNQIDDVIFGN